MTVSLFGYIVSFTVALFVLPSSRLTRTDQLWYIAESVRKACFFRTAHVRSTFLSGKHNLNFGTLQLVLSVQTYYLSKKAVQSSTFLYNKKVCNHSRETIVKAVRKNSNLYLVRNRLRKELHAVQLRFLNKVIDCLSLPLSSYVWEKITRCSKLK